MTKLLIVIIIAVLIGTSIFFITNKKGPSYPSPSASIQATNNNALKTYTNSAYNDSFTYPHDYSINADYPNYLLLKKPTASQYDWTFKVDTYQNATGNSFKDFITNQLLLNCAADGPNASLSCDKVISQTPFTTSSGISGFKIYLNQITKKGGQTTMSEIGPYYVFDISKQTAGKAQAINFYPASFANLTKSNAEDANTLESMAKSFKFN